MAPRDPAPNLPPYSRLTAAFRRTVSLLAISLLTPCLLMVLAVGPVAAQDLVLLGWERVEPGETAMIPVYIVDVSGTAIGRDQPIDLRIQSFSIAVRPDSPFASTPGFTPSGVLDGLSAIISTTVTANDTTSWIAAYDSVSNSIPYVLDDFTMVGVLSVPVSAATPLGTRIDLQLSPTLTALSNQGGNVMINEANGGLGLFEGYVEVETTPLFEDNFETGDVSAWTLSSP